MNCINNKIYDFIFNVVSRLNYKVDSALTNYLDILADDLWTDLSSIDIAITNNLRSSFGPK